MDKLLDTLYGVIAAIGISALIFVGANKFFDLAPTRWRIFNAAVGGLTSFFVFLVLWGNRIIDVGIDDTVITFDIFGRSIEWTLDWTLLILVVGAGVIGAVAGYVIAGIDATSPRIAIGTITGAVLGVLAGVFTVEEIVDEATGEVIEVLPALNYGAAVLYLVIGAFIGAGWWAVFGRRKGRMPTRPIIFWAALGWLIGSWGFADPGGSQAEAILANTVAGLGFGLWFGLTKNADYSEREDIADDSRQYIFLVPALGFIAATLVVPTIRTIILSFKTGSPRNLEWTGVDNYVDIFTDSGIFDLSDWTDIFTSQLFWLGVVLIGAGLLVGAVMGRQTGHAMAATGGSVPPIALGVFLLSFGIFSVLRGTIFNNLWWVFTVTILATSLGLAIAVLADRAKFESVAKSIIFLPMAVSFVGASIIWRFMYIARPPTNPQTGVLNALWVGLGELSHSAARYWVVALLLLVVAGLGYIAWRGWKAGSNGLLAGSIVTALPLLWICYRLLDQSLGGFTTTQAGEVVPQTVLFLQENPFNNVWMMVVLIWIQVGFTMVIFSAAIKAVPAELIEAAKVDGATESQTFWRVIIPQIAPTIGVVVTTMIVLVLKVFDIVKVMTNGNFDTQVIANEMWQRAFTELNFGLGSALAVVLFIGVLPILYINVRRMQKQAA